MNGRENPVTRPSVFRTQDAHGTFASGDYYATPVFTPSNTLHATLHPTEPPSGAAFAHHSPAAGSGYASLGERHAHPLADFTLGDAFGAAHRSGSSPTASPPHAQDLPRHPSVRTFSQLSAIPITPPTTALFATEATSPLPAWGDYNRSAPMSPAEAPGNGSLGAEMLLQRPLGPDSIRDAVYAYLEATDRHDVVMAMLADERRHSQRGTGAAVSGVSTAAAVSFSPAASPNAEGHHVLGRGVAGDANSLRTSFSQGYSGVTSISGPSSTPSHLLTPPREAPTMASAGSPAGGGLEGRRSRQRRSHELLRKGLLDRRASVRQPGEEATHNSGRASPRRQHVDPSPRASSPPPPPPLLDAEGRPSATPSPAAAAATAVPGSHATRAAPPAQRPPQPQQLPKVMPTLCGLEEAVRPDLVLLFADLERKIREQYRQLSIPPPSHEVLQYILTQAYEPMWSVGEDANAYHLFEPANPVTGMVLYGTLNQMVEQLTQVYVMPLSTPPEMVLKSERAFSQAFLRRHRLLMPSHVLLAKLMERYLVPLSLQLGFERFKAHGITVHAPGMGASLPTRRSQSETVLHGRRHPGAAGGNGNAAGGAGASASASGQSYGAMSGESVVWGSRSARPSPAGGRGGGGGAGSSSSSATPGLRPSTNAVVEEYVRATAAATSPDAAVIAMVRSGLFPSLTNDSITALTNAAMGTAPTTTLTSNPASATLPHRGALGGFPSAAAAAVAAAAAAAASTSGGGAAAGFGNLLSGAASRPTVEIVTTYSPSAALWLTVCERVQLKVLSVLLYWLQHHPYHFDGEMLRSVLHFVESCCYGTSAWADAPSRQPQIAEFIRQACHAALPLSTSTRRLPSGAGAAGAALLGAYASPHVMITSAQFAAFPPISRAWREGVLSGTWERRRYQLLSEATPPSLRQSVKAEFLPWTWINPMGSLTPQEYLPCFAFRALPSADIMSYVGEKRQPPLHQRGPSHGGGGTNGGGAATVAASAGAAGLMSDARSGGPEVPTLRAAAQEALRLFGSCTFETYVRGLTAAHYRMFTAFPSQDIFIAAQHTSSSYLSSPVFQSSFLGRFLNSSAVLTSWGVSLLLHAAYLDGERAAAVVAVTNMSILNSFVGDGTDYRALVASEGGGGGGGGGVDEEGAAAAGHSRASSISDGNSSLSTGSAATASVGASSQSGGGAGGSAHDGADGGAASTVAAAATAAAAARLGGVILNPARHFLHVLDRLVDLVVGFLRVNNLHASYSIFRAFTHPFVKRLRQHRRVAAHVHAQTAHRIRKLESFFTSIPPSSANGASAKKDSGAGKHPSTSAAAAAAAAAAADVGDPTVDDELDTAADGATEGATATAAAANGPSSPRAPRKSHHSFFEYLNTVPDSVEYPTVPVVQYYLRELQMMFALEPTFFAVPSHQMQSRFVTEEVRLTGVFTVPRAGLEEEQTPTAASPIAVVNWRKMHLVDDWIQRVSSNQMSCLHYISSRSTVVRHIMPDLDFEKAFDAQLSSVVVTDTSLLQEMANQLYSAL